MSEFFKAAANWKQPIKKHQVTVEGTVYEVTLKESIEMIKHGVENYYIDPNGEIALRVKKNTRYVFPEIETFVGNPYWPTERFTWKK